jgi:hypothetical protein
VALLPACKSTSVAWSGVAIAPAETSTRESSIAGELRRARCFENARIILDRRFESTGFDGVPFAIEPGREHVLVIDSERTSLHVAFEPSERELVEVFVPHFFLDTTVPGVSKRERYTLVCKGGTGRLKIARDGRLLRGDLAVTVACRTYVRGIERDESQILVRGPFECDLASSGPGPGPGPGPGFAVALRATRSSSPAPR